MILENAITEINNCIYEIDSAIDLSEDELETLKEILMDRFIIKLSEHSLYIDKLSGELEYD